jgi:hypothetical protein
VWHTLTGTMLGMKSGFLLSEVATGNKLEKHSAYKRILFLLLIHSHFLPFEERMSQVASTPLVEAVENSSSGMLRVETSARAERTERDRVCAGVESRRHDANQRGQRWYAPLVGR